jgi:hypothetical protein
VTTLLTVVVVVLVVLVVFQGLVLLELVRQLSQVRQQLDLDDRPVPISLGRLAGRPLPEPASGSLREGVLVFLSPDCMTCRLVASGLEDLYARFGEQRLLAVFQARSADEARKMVAEAGLTGDQVVVDLDNEYGAAFGIELRPAAVVVRDGIVSEGAVVRNARQLQQLLERLDPSTEGAHASGASSFALTSGGVR